MKAYRIQARHGIYRINHRLEANNDQDALNKFSELVTTGKVELEDEGFYRAERCYITFEEVESNVNTTVGVKETSAGVEMGSSSVTSRKSND